MTKKLRIGWFWTLMIAAAVSGCGDGSNQSTSASAAIGITGHEASGVMDPPGSDLTLSPSRSSPGTNVLAISGDPPSVAAVGTQYNFAPILKSAKGTTVSFSVLNKPSWATFNAGSGRLSGAPTAADVGTYEGIEISASDGRSQVALPAFAITVPQAGSSSVEISWVPPTTNKDGTEITNLAGYYISYGAAPTSMTQQINVATVGVTDYVVDNLTPGTWYFAVSAYNSAGVASSPTAVVSATIGGWAPIAPHFVSQR